MGVPDKPLESPEIRTSDGRGAPDSATHPANALAGTPLTLRSRMTKSRPACSSLAVLCTPVVKKGMQRGQVATEHERMATGRVVALRQLLRLKVRYSTDGAAVGSRAYVDGLYERCREQFGVGRKSGARRMPAGRRVLRNCCGLSGTC